MVPGSASCHLRSTVVWHSLFRQHTGKPASLVWLCAARRGKAAGYCISMVINKVSHGDFPATLAFMQNRSSHCPLQAPEPPGGWGCALGKSHKRGGELIVGKEQELAHPARHRGTRVCGLSHPKGGSEDLGLPSASKATGSTDQLIQSWGRGGRRCIELSLFSRTRLMAHTAHQ